MSFYRRYPHTYVHYTYTGIYTHTHTHAHTRSGPRLQHMVSEYDIIYTRVHVYYNIICAQRVHLGTNLFTLINLTIIRYEPVLTALGTHFRGVTSSRKNMVITLDSRLRGEIAIKIYAHKPTKTHMRTRERARVCVKWKFDVTCVFVRN